MRASGRRLLKTGLQQCSSPLNSPLRLSRTTSLQIKTAVTSELSIFAARLREHIAIWCDELRSSPAPEDTCLTGHTDTEFNGLALTLFTLQFGHNEPYRKLCIARGMTPGNVTHWTQIPTVPTAAFKEFEMTCLPQEQRTRVFHSSGTTEQRPSRHFHNAESLAVYEASLWPWMRENLRFTIGDLRLLSLTPPAGQVTHSSLVYMFDVAQQKMGADESAFVGRVGADGVWTLDFDVALAALMQADGRPLLVVGTAFSFVHLLDELAARNPRLKLPAGSRVLETGGYKGRSRSMPKAELHALITERLGVASSNIICEYGMSELSSQAYQQRLKPQVSGLKSGSAFHFPPWTRARVISPETSREVNDGDTGILSIVDLANVFSVMAIQTEDLAVRRGDGFELLGRAAMSEPRGCSLTAA